MPGTHLQPNQIDLVESATAFLSKTLQRAARRGASTSSVIERFGSSIPTSKTCPQHSLEIAACSRAGSLVVVTPRDPFDKIASLTVQDCTHGLGCRDANGLGASVLQYGDRSWIRIGRCFGGRRWSSASSYGQVNRSSHIAREFSCS